MEKSLLMWFLFAGLHLMRTGQCEGLQELERRVMGRKHFIAFYSAAAQLRLASQLLCIVLGHESRCSGGFYLKEALEAVQGA